MSDTLFSEPQRQNPVGIIVYILRNFRILGALLVVAFSVGSGKFWIFMGIAVIPLIVFFVVVAYYQFRNFTFQIIGSDLVIKQGIFFKERTVIPADRIQTIQITRNLIQRIFGLVSLKLDTAGSKGSELEIPALDITFAEELKTLLYERKSGFSGDLESNVQDALDFDSESIPETEKERVLVSLGFLDLVKVGLTENHLKTGFIALAFVFGTWNQYQEFLKRYFADYFMDYAVEVVNAGYALILVFLVVYAVVSVLLSLVRTFLRFFDMRAVLRNQTIEVRTGLLKQNQDKIPIKKIQFIEWDTNPLRRLIGFESAKLYPSNSSQDPSKGQLIEIPALRKEQSQILVEGVFSDFAGTHGSLGADPVAYARFRALLGSMVLLPLTGMLFLHYGAQGLFALLLYIPIALSGWLYGRKVFFGLSYDYVQIWKGWVFPVRILIPGVKVQSIEFSQSVFLKRRKLAHLRFHTAAGNRTIRFIPEDEAFKIYNYLMYKVQSHEGSWM